MIIICNEIYNKIYDNVKSYLKINVQKYLFKGNYTLRRVTPYKLYLNKPD